MSFLGAHRISKDRGYSVHRQSGLLTIAITGALAIAILASRGAIISTPPWKPLVEFTEPDALIGGVLLLSSALGILGLALDDDDYSRTPRIVTLASALIGMAWFGGACFAFTLAYANGYANAGPFFAAYGFTLHANRFWLLSEFPQGFLSPRLARAFRRRRA